MTRDQILALIEGLRDTRITALLSSAERAARPDLALRVRHFCWDDCCGKCGVQGPMQAV